MLRLMKVSRIKVFSGTIISFDLLVKKGEKREMPFWEVLVLFGSDDLCSSSLCQYI